MTDQSGAQSVRLAAIAVLDQGAAFIEAMDDGCYTKSVERLGGATVGQHVRHALDHFAALMAGFIEDGAGPVAYDRRSRGTAVETDRAAALAQLSELRGHLGELDDVQLLWPLTIRVLPAADGAEVDIDSTFVRELAFVTHHAIHHWAMCRIATGELDATCDEAFGRAPSTLAFERK